MLMEAAWQLVGISQPHPKALEAGQHLPEQRPNGDKEAWRRNVGLRASPAPLPQPDPIAPCPVLPLQDLRAETPLTDLWHHDFWGSRLSSNTSHKSYRPLTVLTFR